jgi:predicted HicB family RNase H-like nuclease
MGKQKSVIFNFALSEELKKQIEEAAKKLGLSIGAYMRLAVCEKLNKGE